MMRLARPRPQQSRRLGPQLPLPLPPLPLAIEQRSLYDNNNLPPVRSACGLYPGKEGRREGGRKRGKE